MTRRSKRTVVSATSTASSTSSGVGSLDCRAPHAAGARPDPAGVRTGSDDHGAGTARSAGRDIRFTRSKASIVAYRWRFGSSSRMLDPNIDLKPILEGELYGPLRDIQRRQLGRDRSRGPHACLAEWRRLRSRDSARLARPRGRDDRAGAAMGCRRTRRKGRLTLESKAARRRLGCMMPAISEVDVCRRSSRLPEDHDAPAIDGGRRAARIR